MYMGIAVATHISMWQKNREAIEDEAVTFNPLSPRDALKHHFTSLKTDLIFLQQRVLKRKIL